MDKAYHIIEYYALKVIRHFEHMQIIHGRFTVSITNFTCKAKYRAIYLKLTANKQDYSVNMFSVFSTNKT